MVPATRRRLLRGAAAGAVAALAGCFEFGTGCPRDLTLRLTETTDADIAKQNAQSPSELHPIGRDLVRTANDSGTATYRSMRGPPVPGREYVELDDGYYEVVMETVEETTVTGYAFDVAMDEETDEQGPSGSSIAFADLPEHDQQAFLVGLGYLDERKLEGANSMSGSATIAYAEQSLLESSVLVPDPKYEYVRYRERYFRLEKTDTEEATVRTYEVRLERVAGSPAELAEMVREERGVGLRRGDLSERQREILEQAIEDGYDECAEYETPTQDLVDRFGDAEYVRYDDTWYAVDLYESVV